MYRFNMYFKSGRPGFFMSSMYRFNMYYIHINERGLPMSKTLFDASGHLKKEAIRSIFSASKTVDRRYVNPSTKARKHLKLCSLCRTRRDEAFMEHAINKTLFLISTSVR